MAPKLSVSPRWHAALAGARRELRAAATPAGHWVGQLSSSALSTATAVCALAILGKNSAGKANDFSPLIARGLAWLVAHVNRDGGWGDTLTSHSNLSTTTLVWAAFGAVPGAEEQYRSTVAQAEGWLRNRAGGLEAEQLAPAIIKLYGKDRTFSVPILTMCALAGRLGTGREAWRWVLPLPFELAACPHQWYALLRLPVVSYALPALIAIGQARHHHCPTRILPLRLIRNMARRRTLDLLDRIQPSSGGFLEATPLTSFVVMSLAAIGQAGHPAAIRGAGFLIKSAQADGSWAIDSNLSLWVTTLAINALNWPAPEAAGHEAREQMELAREWLLRAQYQTEHPYTHAAPGGWAWTDLPGGVPDADDTAGALLALQRLGPAEERVKRAAAAGIGWLLGLQNSDGGIPTFCRGWGALPFDRSGPDLTAHALRAWSGWLSQLPDAEQIRVRSAIAKGVGYLAQTQRADGSWVPLWFGNQHALGEENPTYGTARVVRALQEIRENRLAEVGGMLSQAGNWLLAAQRPAGGWSGYAGEPCSVEETALAVEALAGFLTLKTTPPLLPVGAVAAAVIAGVNWLVERVENGQWKTPAPIGFYFARLWYYEQLYPMIFTVGALERAVAAGVVA